MSNKTSIQVLNDCAQNQADQIKNLQITIRKLSTLKKDTEIQQQKEALIQQIEKINDSLQDLQTKAADVHSELTDKRDEKPEDKLVAKETGQGVADGEPKHKRSDRKDSLAPLKLPLPEDQEYAYQLKARMMPHVFAQTQNIKAEIVLMNKRNELRDQRKHKQINYQKETNLSAVTTLRAIQNYERKAKAAEAQVAELQAELQVLRGEDKVKQRPNSDSFLGPNNRVNDVIKKNEGNPRMAVKCLLDENQDHRKEIQRLKLDNTELIKKVKLAQQDRHQMMAHLSTSEMARRDLHSRMQKQKVQHDRLFRSMTRQSSDWIEARKAQDQAEDEYRWNHVGYAAPHGGYERTFSHKVPKNVNQPRYMFPVESYAQSSTA